MWFNPSLSGVLLEWQPDIACPRPDQPAAHILLLRVRDPADGAPQSKEAEDRARPEGKPETLGSCSLQRLIAARSNCRPVGRAHPASANTASIGRVEGARAPMVPAGRRRIRAHVIATPLCEKSDARASEAAAWLT